MKRRVRGSGTRDQDSGIRIQESGARILVPRGKTQRTMEFYGFVLYPESCILTPVFL